MILIVDDDVAVQASMRLLLRNEGLESVGIQEPESVVPYLHQHRVELVMLDMNFSVETSGEEGLQLLKEIRTNFPHLPVILITGWATMALAIEGMKAGANDFMSKPWSNEQMIQAVQTALALSTPASSSGSRQQLDKNYDFAHIIGEDTGFVQVLETVGRVAPTDASVLILGESGTGKELIAEAVHQNSQRNNRPFVKVNLGGISSSLFESELFGHVRGAFTDARFDRKGRFASAHSGTIFLDEIGDLDLSSQVKLLRVLQDRTYEVLGSSKTQKADVRVISATNRNLSEMVQDGTFREDLFYRINLITVHIPALRDRPSDIPLLVNHYLRNLAQLYQRPQLKVTPSAMKWLQQFPFPGNIRQLKNLVERTVLISRSDTLEVSQFQQHLDAPRRKAGDTSLPEVGTMSLEEMEKEMIIKAMAHYQNRITKVARALGLTRSALYRRLEKYQIPYE